MSTEESSSMSVRDRVALAIAGWRIDTSMKGLQKAHALSEAVQLQMLPLMTAVEADVMNDVPGWIP